MVQKKTSIEISDKLVKLKVNHKLIKFVIDWQFNHAKPRTAKTKQRNEIKGSTKKIVLKKAVAERDMLVKKLHYLLAEVWHMDQKVPYIR
jgi:ribosomal protein L4